MLQLRSNKQILENKNQLVKAKVRRGIYMANDRMIKASCMQWIMSTIANLLT